MDAIKCTLSEAREKVKFFASHKGWGGLEEKVFDERKNLRVSESSDEVKVTGDSGYYWTRINADDGACLSIAQWTAETSEFRFVG